MQSNQSTLNIVFFQQDSVALKRERQLSALTQYDLEPIWHEVHWSTQVIRSGGRDGKSRIIMFQEARQKSVANFHSAVTR